MTYRFGKVYWDYDPCEDCNAEECEKCEYGEENGRKTQDTEYGEDH